MKRRGLEQHMRADGCALYRHGSGHDIWLNPKLSLTAAVPRHNEVKSSTARAICKSLNIPRPPGV